MSAPGMFWFTRSANAKLGDMPQAVVGATSSETWHSCDGCKLREHDCYAWESGKTTRNFVLPKIERGLAVAPERYTIESALKNRARSARYVRMTTIGDPARANRLELLRTLATVQDEGLGVLGYTHFWRENTGLRWFLMASCDTVEDATEALALGWRVTVILPWDHYLTSGPRFAAGDVAGVVCPAQTKAAVTCNSCWLCSGGHQAAKRVRAIGFLDHGKEARKARRRRLPAAVVA